MKPSRAILAFWLGLIAVLVVVEIAQVTRYFTLPIQSVVGNPLAFVFALAFTTLLALVGAIFAGIYIAQRLISPKGFTPFEEEMLRMRAEVAAIRAQLDRRAGEADASPPSPDEPDEARR